MWPFFCKNFIWENFTSIHKWREGFADPTLLHVHNYQLGFRLSPQPPGLGPHWLLGLLVLQREPAKLCQPLGPGTVLLSGVG